MTRGAAKDSPPELTPPELEVMNALWEKGPASAREVHDEVAERTGWAYSTTRTLLTRMAAKGWVERRRFHGLYVFDPRLSRPRALAPLVLRFARSVVGLPADRVVSLFTEGKRLPAEDLAELSALVETLGQDDGASGA